MTSTRIRIKIGAREIEIEGSEEYVKSVIGEDFFGAIDKLSEYELPTTPTQIIQDDDSPENPPKTDTTSILAGVEGPSACLRTLLNSDWGKTPHSYAEIKEVFELNAKYFDDSPLTGTITRLIKNGDIRRIGKKGDYQYLGNFS